MDTSMPHLRLARNAASEKRGEVVRLESRRESADRRLKSVASDIELDRSRTTGLQRDLWAVIICCQELIVICSMPSCARRESRFRVSQPLETAVILGAFTCARCRALSENVLKNRCRPTLC